MTNTKEDLIVKALQQYTTYVSHSLPLSKPRAYKLTKQQNSCDVSDALIKLKYRNGGFLSGLTMWSPHRQEGATKIVGPAYTVQYVPLSDPRPKMPTHYVSETYLLLSVQSFTRPFPKKKTPN